MHNLYQEIIFLNKLVFLDMYIIANKTIGIYQNQYVDFLRFFFTGFFEIKKDLGHFSKISIIPVFHNIIIIIIILTVNLNFHKNLQIFSIYVLNSILFLRLLKICPTAHMVKSVEDVSD